MFNRLIKFFKNTVIYIWIKLNSYKGNIHLKSDKAVLKKVPFIQTKIWLRPTISDTVRVIEYLSRDYFLKSYLHDALKNKKPSTLIDIGANIGLASLSLLDEFPSIRKVIAIEAEIENFKILEKNFNYWKTKYSKINFLSINKVASHSNNLKMKITESLSELTNGKYSASGTFKFEEKTETISTDIKDFETISINELISGIAINENIIVKMDIEGGEEYLLSKNTEWLNRCSYLMTEIHDDYHPSLINASKNLIKVLNQEDFAISTSNKCLYCYNKKKLFNNNIRDF